MKTIVPIALLAFLIGSLTQAASVPENLLQSANEVQGKDAVEHVNNKGFEDDLSEDDATDDDVEDEEDEGDQEDKVTEDEEEFDSDEDPERKIDLKQDAKAKLIGVQPIRKTPHFRAPVRIKKPKKPKIRKIRLRRIRRIHFPSPRIPRGRFGGKIGKK